MEIPSFTKEWHTTMYPAIDSSQPSLSTKGKNVVVSGGGTGIGAATAYHFARSGASSVTILGRRPDRLISTQALLQTEFPAVKVLYFSVDVTDKAGVDAAFKDIHAQVGEIHVLIANAGYRMYKPPAVFPISHESVGSQVMSQDKNSRDHSSGPLLSQILGLTML